MKTLFRSLLFVAISLIAGDVPITTTTRVYEVPLKYIDQYDLMLKEGKLVKSDTKTYAGQNVFEHKGTVIIFQGNNKYENMNAIIELLKQYANGLDNVDSEKVERVLNLLKVEKQGSKK